MIIAILIFILIAVVYISLILPRLISSADMSQLAVDYAHRGLHGEGLPENSLGAFEEAVEHRYGIELDVQLSRDGVPVVFHDDTLLRVCGVDGAVRDHDLADLQKLDLSGNADYTIPTLRQVLDLVDGRVPLLIELKTGSKGLWSAVMPMLDEYGGSFCIESFDPRLLAEVGRTRPRYARGQLVGRSVKEKHTKSLFLNILLATLMSHVISRPDFVACDINMKGNLSVFLCRKLFHIPVFGWTVRNAEQYALCKKSKMNTIFEDILP